MKVERLLVGGGNEHARLKVAAVFTSEESVSVRDCCFSGQVGDVVGAKDVCELEIREV